MIASLMEESPDANTTGDDDYNPKAKSLRLSICEKIIIAIGSLIVVLLMILVHHPELYRTEQSPPSAPGASIQQMGAVESLLLPGWAKPTETHEFASFNLDKSVGTYNVDYSGLTLSSVGIGTYLGETTEEVDAAMKTAVYDSVMKGVNVIDTAINYRGMKSERCVGTALKRLLQSGFVARDSLFISTKAGFIPADADKGTSPLRTTSEWAAAVSKYGDFPQQEIVGGKHCIAPACLNMSLTTSRNNLGVETIDLFYLHNAAENQLGNVDDFKARLSASFSYLEEQRYLNTIRFYGMATWDSFTSDSDSPNHLSLYEVVKLAEKIGGENHGFRYIQVPITVSIPGGAMKKTQTMGLTILESAASLNITVMSSRSIGGAKYDSLATTELIYHSCLPKESDYSVVLNKKMLKISMKHSAKTSPHNSHVHLSQAAKSLLVTRSIPGVTTALVGMKLINHVNENVNILNLPLIPRNIITDCILSKAQHAQIDKPVPHIKNRNNSFTTTTEISERHGPSLSHDTDSAFEGGENLDTSFSRDGPVVKGNILPRKGKQNKAQKKKHGHIRRKKE